MFDTAFNSQFPPGAQAYAAYVDGGVGDQPNYDWIVKAFPQARHLSIALFAGHNADALDVEARAAVPPDIPGWYARQVARGIARPVIYASVSTMNDSVLPVLGQAGIARVQVRLWTAHYGLGEHICGPHSCGALSVDADGTQWTSSAMGLDLDQSLLAADFFGTAPFLTPTEMIMQALPVVQQGSTDRSAVRRVQALVNAAREDRGMAAILEDGVFGPATAGALKQAQGWGGTAQDGICGPATWALLLGV